MRWISYLSYGAALAAVTAASIAYIDVRDLKSLFDRSQRNSETVRRLEAERARLEAACAALEERVEGLASDPVEIEAAIRTGKNLVRRDEQVYRIALPDETSSETAAQP